MNSVTSPKEDRSKCCFCGGVASTSDHIPPEGIFTKPYPPDLITVPACELCNNNTSKDDEYFRVIVAATSNDSQQSLALLRQRILPKIERKPALAISILKSSRKIGNSSSIDVDTSRIQTVLNKIVRGLFWKHTNQIFPKDGAIGDYVQNPKISEPMKERILTLPLKRGRSMILTSFEVEPVEKDFNLID